jgi:hypothetical protein
MYHTANNALSIHDIQQIFLEDQCLFDETIAALKQRNSIDKLDASQPQHHSNQPRDGKGLQRL